MDVAIFIKTNHLSTGMDRFLRSLTIYNDCQIIECNTIEETNLDVKVGIFGGFLPQDLIQSKIKKKYYVFCSPFGQADLSGNIFYAPEIQILIQLIDLIKKGFITNGITSSKSLEYRFGFLRIPPVKTGMMNHISFKMDRKDYGFLGNNMRKHKNVANQLAAISMLEPKEKIIVKNSEMYGYWSYMFGCEFEETGYLQDSEYYKEISSHRLCFQCSFSESFDYQAFEYAFMGIPTIHSSCLDWYPIKEHLIKNTDSVEEIHRVAQNALNSNKYWSDSEYLSHWAVEFNESNKNKVYDIYQGMKK